MVALEIALGGRIEEYRGGSHRAVAQEGIELLQRAKAGRATFLPLDMGPAGELLSAVYPQ